MLSFTVKRQFLQAHIAGELSKGKVADTPHTSGALPYDNIRSSLRTEGNDSRQRWDLAKCGLFKERERTASCLLSLLRSARPPWCFSDCCSRRGAIDPGGG